MEHEVGDVRSEDGDHHGQDDGGTDVPVPIHGEVLVITSQDREPCGQEGEWDTGID